MSDWNYTHQARRANLISQCRAVTVDDDQAVQRLRQLRWRAFLWSRVPPIARHPRQVDRITWQYPRVVTTVHAQLPSLIGNRKQKEPPEMCD